MLLFIKNYIKTHFSIQTLCCKSAYLLAAIMFILSGCCTSQNESLNAIKDKPYMPIDMTFCLSNDASSITLSNQSYILLEQISVLYTLKHADLLHEIDLLSNNKDIPSKLKLAAALARTQQLSDTQRALSILDEVIAQSPDTNNLCYTWATILRSTAQETHSLLNKLAQQKRLLQENTKQISELNYKLNALRAIEASLGSR